MNHKSIVEFESERIYRNRSYIAHKLADSTFYGLLDGQHDLGLDGYCLDALDEIPGGSMLSAAQVDFDRRRGRRERGTQHYTIRERTWAELEERRALADKLIAEILAEEKHA